MTTLSRRAFLIAAAAAGITASLAGCAPAVTGRVPTRPAGALRTSWSTDPFALGSYSFLAPGALGTDARTGLAAPVGRLHFAGEATSSGAPATTHGALDSGVRAAQEVAEFGGRIVVIGAGIAGLTAARILNDDGYDVIVVEARDRLGGRATTVEFAGGPAELGASWIHGVTDNPVAALADEAGVDLIPFDYDDSVGGDDEALDGIDLLTEAALDAPAEALSSLLPAELSIAARWALATEIGDEFGAEPSELAAGAIDEGDELLGGDALLDGGYSELVDELGGDLAVQLNWVVADIRHDETGVVVTSTTGAQIVADRAIVTLPVGVLRYGPLSFTPPLPPQKTEALAGLGSGLLDKLWLSFDDVFWDPHVTLMNWIDPDNPGRWGQWINGYAAFGTPTLLAFNSANRAREIAAWSDEDVVLSAMDALRSMTA